MSIISTLQNRFLRSIHSFIVGACLMAQSTVSLHAQVHYLAAGHTDEITVLASPPVVGSKEAAADLAEAKAVFKSAKPDDMERAMSEEDLSVFAFTPGVGSFFQAGMFPKTEAMMKRIGKETGKAANGPKEHWKRARPHDVDPEFPMEPGFSYPSSHSTRGTVYALVLSELFPDNRDAILAIGREIGWDRVRAGKHFPADVQAGRVLGQAVFRELMASEAFQKDLAEAKAEITASTAAN